MKKKQRRIGLVLGGGGARGWAHIGVIHAIREAGLDVACVVGTSMGALVGAAFASGRLDDLQAVAQDLDWRQVLALMSDISLSRTGLIDGKHIVDFVQDHVMPGNIEDLPLPYAAIATDIRTGDEVVLRRGSIAAAVRASIAIPGLFTPLCLESRVLVDGGLVNPLPVNVAREMEVDFIIAVDITRSPLPSRQSDPRTQSSRRVQILEGTQRFLEKLHLNVPQLDGDALPAIFRPENGTDQPSLVEIYGNMMRIFQRQITIMHLALHPPDLLIQPDVQDISTMEFHRATDAIRAGHEAATQALRRIDDKGRVRQETPEAG
ncbi:MAG: patatin-like phospholipase family protein [Kiritimatiellia bacterium]